MTSASSAQIRLAMAGACAWLLACPALALAADGEDAPLGIEPAARATETSGGSGVLRTIVGLVVVIGLILGLTWVLKTVKRAREAQASGTALQTLATLPLGPNRSLHLVRAGDVVVLLAVGEGGTTAIRTYHEEEARSLGLLPVPSNDGGLGALTAPVGAGLADGRGSADGKVVRLLEEIRRRTVIR